MAASYQTGTASSPTNLLTTLVTWLVAQGWTSNASASDGAGWKAHLSKAGVYVNLRAAINESIWTYSNGAGYGLGVYLGDAYAAVAWNAQGGAPLQSGTANVIGAGVSLPSGAVTKYHFFDDGSDHITIVVERTPGVFGFIGWGPSMAAMGFAGSFPYFYGSSPSYYSTSAPTGSAGANLTAHSPFSRSWSIGSEYHGSAFWKVDATTWPARWVSNAGSSSTAAGYTGKTGRTAAAFLDEPVDGSAYPNYSLVRGQRSWQTSYPGAALLLLYAYVQRESGRYAPCGYPPTVFLCEAYGHGFGAGEVYAVLGVNYMVFPNFAVKKLA